RTDREGRFVFPVLPQIAGDQTASIRASAEGFPAQTQRLGGGAAIPCPLVVRLAPAVIVRGRCVDESGRPVAALRVRSGSNRAAKTGAAGAFELQGVAGRDATFVLDADGFAPLEVKRRLGDAPVQDTG